MPGSGAAVRVEHQHLTEMGDHEQSAWSDHPGRQRQPDHQHPCRDLPIHHQFLKAHMASVREQDQDQRDLGDQVDRFIETLNRGAEEAAKEAKPIFVGAIKDMTVQDAWGILKGEDNAATMYLQDKTSAQLTSKFKPVIKRALDKTNATKYYSDLVNTYNKIPFVEKVNPNLDDYATERALSGLFTLVAKEEQNIRDNPGARTTELLKKVFSKQD